MRRTINGMVLKIDRRHNSLILATPDRSFVRVPLPHGFQAEVGELVSVPAQSFNPARWLAVAALFLLMLGGSMFGYLFFTPHYYVAMDINPSLELTVNRFERIVGVTSYNEAGMALVQSCDVEFKPVQAGIENLVNEAVALQYISPERLNQIWIAVSPEKTFDSEKQLLHLKASLEATLDTLPVSTQLIPLKASAEQHRKAVSEGCSVNKVIIQEEIAPDSDLKQIKDVPPSDVVGLRPEDFPPDIEVTQHGPTPVQSGDPPVKVEPGDQPPEPNVPSTPATPGDQPPEDPQPNGEDPDQPAKPDEPPSSPGGGDSPPEP